MKKPQVLNPLMNAQASVKAPKLTKEEGQKKIRDMWDYDHEMVTVVFENKENPAKNGGIGMLQFGFKKYAGDQYTFYELWDGERYTLPRMVANHLGNGCFYKEYQRLPGEFGNNDIRQGFNPEGRMITNRQQMARKVHRFGVKSLEFMDDNAMDMQPSNLVEVTL